jgi:hypothetical protein
MFKYHGTASVESPERDLKGDEDAFQLNLLLTCVRCGLLQSAIALAIDKSESVDGASLAVRVHNLDLYCNLNILATSSPSRNLGTSPISLRLRACWTDASFVWIVET